MEVLHCGKSKRNGWQTNSLTPTLAWSGSTVCPGWSFNNDRNRFTAILNEVFFLLDRVWKFHFDSSLGRRWKLFSKNPCRISQSMSKTYGSYTSVAGEGYRARAHAWSWTCMSTRTDQHEHVRIHTVPLPAVALTRSSSPWQLRALQRGPFPSVSYCSSALYWTLRLLLQSILANVSSC